MDTKAIQVSERVEVGILMHEGKEFSAYGYTRTDTHLTAYLSKDGQLTKWNGEVIGTYRIASSWRVYSFISNYMNQVYATLADGTKWTGRCGGEGLACNFKRCK